MTPYYLYHISTYNEIGQLDKGYIGITNNPEKRFYQHKHNPVNEVMRQLKNDGIKVTYTIVTKGSQSDMKAMEKWLRPRMCMGWNCQSGGHNTRPLKYETRVDLLYKLDQEGKRQFYTFSNGKLAAGAREYEEADCNSAFVSLAKVTSKWFNKQGNEWIEQQNDKHGRWELYITAPNKKKLVEQLEQLKDILLDYRYINSAACNKGINQHDMIHALKNEKKLYINQYGPNTEFRKAYLRKNPKVKPRTVKLPWSK